MKIEYIDRKFSHKIKWNMEKALRMIEILLGIQDINRTINPCSCKKK